MQQAREIFSERLKKIMNREHITQAELAKKINVTRQSISLYINGERNPDIAILKNIAEVLYVSTDYLLGLSDYETNNGDMQAFCKETGLTEDAAMLLNALFSENISSIIEAPHFEDVINKIDDLKRYSTYLIEDIEQYGIENSRHFSDTVDLYRYRAIKSFEKLLDSFDMRIKRKAEFEEIEKQHLTLVSVNKAKMDELYQKYSKAENNDEKDQILKEIVHLRIEGREY